MKAMGKSNLFQLYFKRIVCIILLPMLVLGGIYVFYYKRQMRLDIEKDMWNIARSLQSGADRLLDAANSEAIQMAMQLEKSKLFTLSLNYEQEINELASLRGIMETACRLDDTIEVFALRQSKGKVLCQLGYYDLKDYSDIATLRAIEEKGWREHMLVDLDARGEFRLAFYYSVPLSQRAMENYVYVKVSARAVTGILSGIEDHAAFMIRDSGGRALLSAGDEIPDFDGERIAPGEVVHENGVYSLTMASETYPFYYTVVRADEYAHRNALFVNATVIAIYITMALLGLLCAWMLARQLSFPISTLVLQIQKHLNRAKENSASAIDVDEIAYLFEAMDVFIKNEKTLLGMLNDRKQTAIHSLLRHALEGDGIDADELDSLKKDYDFSPCANYFAFALDVRAEALISVSVYQLNAIMHSVYGEACGADATYAFLMPGGKIGGVVGGNDLSEYQALRATRQMWNQLSNTLAKAPLVIGCGHIVSSLGELGMAYASAVRALKRGGQFQGGVVGPDSPEAQEEAQGAKESVRWISLIEENPSQARRMIEELYETRFRALELNELREYCLWLLIRSYIRMEEKNIEIPERRSLYPLVRQIQSAEDGRALLLAQTDLLAAHMEAKRSQQMTSLMVQTVKYMEENYAQDISLTEVADRLNVSPQHLSACFRKEMGVTFTDSLNQLRLQKARDMILATHLPINRVAELNGYNSPQYFIRRFKEAYGVSPSKYKN